MVASKVIGSGVNNPTKIEPPLAVSGNKLYTTEDNADYRTNNICPYPDDSGWWIEHGGSSVANFNAYDDDGVLQWSVAHTDINANSNGWLGFLHWDTVNNEIYVCVVYHTGWVYVASLDPATGAITQKFNTLAGNITSSTVESVNGFYRMGNDSGNWVIVGNKYVKIVDDNGVTVLAERRYSVNNGFSYMSPDNIIISQWLVNGSGVDGDTYAFALSPNHPRGLLLRHLTKFYGVIAPSSTAVNYVVGDKICFTTPNATTTHASSRMYYDRIDFDRWLKEIFEDNGGVI